MFSITVAFGPTNTPWVLLFKSREKAVAAHESLRADVNTIEVADEFGQSLFADRSQINAVLFEDMEQTHLAYIERALHQERTNAKARMMAQSDPTIRAAMAHQGPSVLTPGGFRGN